MSFSGGCRAPRIRPSQGVSSYSSSKACLPATRAQSTSEANITFKMLRRTTRSDPRQSPRRTKWTWIQRRTLNKRKAKLCLSVKRKTRLRKRLWMQTPCTLYSGLSRRASISPRSCLILPIYASSSLASRPP